MGHIDENVNGTYCEICKRNIAINEKFCGVSYLCNQCRDKHMNEMTATDLVLMGIQQRGGDLNKALKNSDIMHDLMKEEKQLPPLTIKHFKNCKNDCAERGQLVCTCHR